MDAQVLPEGSLEVLSQAEVSQLLDTSRGGLYELYRQCSLAVLNCGSDIDDGKLIMEQYRDFSIRVLSQERGVKLELRNAPLGAFVDGEMIRGIKEHLFAVLRDIVYTSNEIVGSHNFDLTRSSDITNAIFHILRNAGILSGGDAQDLVVCWGGHSINREEYDYTKVVGYELGLRGLNVCTGCGPGAMKGPMKGATIGHAKQRISSGRYIGMTEPGIVASEPPNPIVNELVILPDIEKRLEAFVRVGHGIVIFPGGAGTTEEMLYLLGILMHPQNAGHIFPLILTGPAESAEYFDAVDRYIGETLGPEAQKYYRIVVDDPVEVARAMKKAMDDVKLFRQKGRDAFYFNWQLHIEKDFQEPFAPSHAAMAELSLHRDQPAHKLAANLRRAFSGIVAGNVKEDGIQAVERHGPFEIHGDARMVAAMDDLLQRFVQQRRMKLQGEYTPCYTLVG